MVAESVDRYLVAMYGAVSIVMTARRLKSLTGLA